MLSFGIIPAAGASARMGTNKLLLPWNDSTVLEQVVAAWRESRVDEVLIVIRRGDDELARLARRGGATVITPRQPPAEMRESVAIALGYIEQHFTVRDQDAWLLAPADLPGLTSELIDKVLAAYDTDHPSIVVPQQGTRRGHPVLFPWSLRCHVERLPTGEGLRSLLDSHPVKGVPMLSESMLQDVDTPADYQRLRATALDRRLKNS